MLGVDRFRVSKKGVIIASSVAVVIVGIITGVVIYNHTQNTASSNTALEVPEFTPVTPNGKSIEDLTDWRRNSPPGNAPVFVFADTIGDVDITVSQQDLPEVFKDNVSVRLADLAKNYNASNQIEAQGVRVYIGASAKGPQSAIFSKNNLLILIKSQDHVEDEDWIKYIESLS